MTNTDDAILEMEEAAFKKFQTTGGHDSRQTGDMPEVEPFVVVDQPQQGSRPATRIPPAWHPRPPEQRTPSCNCKKPLTYLGLGCFTGALAAGSIYLCTELLNYANNDQNSEDDPRKIEGARYLGAGLGVLGALYLVTTMIEWWRCSQPKEPGTFFEETTMAACGPLDLCLYCCGRLLGGLGD